MLAYASSVGLASFALLSVFLRKAVQTFSMTTWFMARESKTEPAPGGGERAGTGLSNCQPWRAWWRLREGFLLSGLALQRKRLYFASTGTVSEATMTERLQAVYCPNTQP